MKRNSCVNTHVNHVGFTWRIEFGILLAGSLRFLCLGRWWCHRGLVIVPRKLAPKRVSFAPGNLWCAEKFAAGCRGGCQWEFLRCILPLPCGPWPRWQWADLPPKFLGFWGGTSQVPEHPRLGCPRATRWSSFGWSWAPGRCRGWDSFRCCYCQKAKKIGICPVDFWIYHGIAMYSLWLGLSACKNSSLFKIDLCFTRGSFTGGKAPHWRRAWPSHR